MEEASAESGQVWVAAVDRAVRGRRLRAGAGLRADRDGRRRQHLGGAPRSPAAGRAAGHRRPDASRRQAQGPSRPRRLLLRRSRRASRASGRWSGTWSTRSCRARGWRRRVRQVAVELAARTDRPADAARHHAHAAGPHARGRSPRVSLGDLRHRPPPRPGRDHGGRARHGAAGRWRRRASAGRGVLAAGRGARARRPDPASARERGRDRRVGPPHDGIGRSGRGLRPAARAARRALAGARDPALPQAHAQAARRDVALDLRADRAGLVLRRHAAGAGPGRRPLVHARRRARG